MKTWYNKKPSDHLTEEQLDTYADNLAGPLTGGPLEGIPPTEKNLAAYAERLVGPLTRLANLDYQERVTKARQTSAPGRKAPQKIQPWQGEDWPAGALCRDAPGDWIDLGEGINRLAAQRKTYELELCKLCPVRKPCLEFAVKTRQKHGIWGGTLPAERAARKKS